jgi:hypothetical protein
MKPRASSIVAFFRGDDNSKEGEPREKATEKRNPAGNRGARINRGWPAG